MNTNDFRKMYEEATQSGEGTLYSNYEAIRDFGAERIGQDRPTGRAWMTYIDIRQGAGFMGQPQPHEIAVAEVAKSHKGF